MFWVPKPILCLKALVAGPLPFLLLFHFSGFWQPKAPKLTSSYGRFLLSKSKCFFKVKVSYSFLKALKRTSQSFETLMLTSHDLFLFSKWGGSLPADSVVRKALGHLPSWFTFSPLPEVLGSLIRCWSRNHHLSHHSFLGRGHLSLIGHPLSFAPTF